MANRNVERKEKIEKELVVWSDDLFNVIAMNDCAEKHLKKSFGDTLKLKVNISDESINFVNEAQSETTKIERNKNEIKWRVYEQRSINGNVGYIIIGKVVDFESIELYFQEIIEKIPGSVYWKDVDGKYLGCNKFVAKMAGEISIDNVIGKTDFDMPWKNVAKEITNTDLHVMKERCTVEVEERPTLKDGNELVMLTNKHPLFNKYDKLIGIIGTSIDITELKTTQKALADSLQKLSSAYRERINFISEVSHEIRGPISNAQFIMKFLLDSNAVNSLLNREQKELIKMSHEEINHTLESIRFLVAVFELDNKKRLPEYSVFELKPVIENLKLKFSNNTNAIDIKINVEENIKDIKSDIFIITEILEILIKNSIRFSNNHVDIKITAEYDSINNKINIKLKDKGIGISPESLGNLNLSTIIAKSDNNNSDYFNANIRLTYVKKLLNLVCASLNIKSKKGNGTEIVICFPYKESENLLSKDNNASNEAYQDKYLMKKILLVEDNELTKTIEHGVLSEIWINVDTCNDGISAIEMMSDFKYDIVFLDISLPDINGIKVLKSARSTISRDAIFVALTSHTSDDDIENFINNGFATVIPKPITKLEIEMFLIELRDTNFYGS